MESPKCILVNNLRNTVNSNHRIQNKPQIAMENLTPRENYKELILIASHGHYKTIFMNLRLTDPLDHDPRGFCDGNKAGYD